MSRLHFPSSLRLVCLAALVAGIGCSDDHTITIDAQRDAASVSLTVDVCDTNNEMCTSARPVFTSDNDALGAQVVVDVDQMAYPGAALRIRFTVGGIAMPHCEQIDVELETAPLTFQASVSSNGDFIEVSCAAEGACTNPITCQPFSGM